MAEFLRSIAPAQGFALASIYAAGLFLLGIGAFFGLSKGGTAMTLATAAPVTEVAIPQIDTIVPGETATATFSLG